MEVHRQRDPQGPLIVGIALAVSGLLGLIAGSAFLWASIERAWNIFLAGFLWTLISAAGTALLRCVRERLRYGDWRRGLQIGSVMTFPLTTLYLLMVGLTSAGARSDLALLADGSSVARRPDLIAVAPVLYGITLLLAFFVGPLYALTSPYGRNHS